MRCTFVRRAVCVVACAAATGLAGAQATPARPGDRSEVAAELVRLVNAYRSSPQTCEGRRTVPAGPLAPRPDLSVAPTPDGRALQNALKEHGYTAAQVQALTLSGPATAQAAMAYMAQRFCATLASPRYADIGVSKAGSTWHVVLARPLLAGDLGGWQDAGQEILKLTNAARGEARSCGGKKFAAAPPLTWVPALGAAALAHSRDMADRNYFDHRGKDGSQVSGRASREGYAWQSIGENIAAGQGSPAQAMAAWLASPRHCANLMDRGFMHMGAAYAVNTDSDAAIYWTQVLGAAR
jgi:uncharacterized protein YkwD